MPSKKKKAETPDTADEAGPAVVPETETPELEIVTEEAPETPDSPVIPAEEEELPMGDDSLPEPWNDPLVERAQSIFSSKKEIRSLPVPLTPEEHQASALKLADVIDEIQDLEAEKKAESARIAEAIKDAETKQRLLQSRVRSQSEEKRVVTRWLFGVRGTEDGKPFFDNDYKTLVRLDTGAAVEILPIREDERQLPVMEPESAVAGDSEDGPEVPGPDVPPEWLEGHEHRSKGGVRACPYSAGSEEAQNWKAGWDAADTEIDGPITFGEEPAAGDSADVTDDEV